MASAGAADRDLPMKLRTAGALAASGYYSRINVRLSATADNGLADVTDVDVLGIRHDITFAPRFIAVSCKSGANVQVAKEVFYLRGVMEYLNAQDAVASFALPSIDPHLRDLGRQLRVLVLAGSEGDGWRLSLLNGLPATGYFDPGRHSNLIQAVAAPEMKSLREWIDTDFWFYRDFRNLPRGINRLRSVATQFTGNKPWHSVLFFEVAGHLALTVLDLCRTVQMLGKQAVTETVSAYLFGGATAYRTRKELYARVKQVLSETGAVAKQGSALGPLEPSYTTSLAELVVRFLERPHASIQVPQVIQDAVWTSLGAKGLSFDQDVNGIAAQKLAEDLLGFLRAAAGCGWAPSILAGTQAPSVAPSSPATQSALPAVKQADLLSESGE